MKKRGEQMNKVARNRRKKNIQKLGIKLFNAGGDQPKFLHQEYEKDNLVHVKL